MPIAGALAAESAAAVGVDFVGELQYDDRADQMEGAMADLQPLSKDAAGGDEHPDPDKRQEFRELRGRIKELRETIQHLGSRRKALEARLTEVAAELGVSRSPK